MVRAHDTLLGYLHPNEIAAVFHKSLFDLFGYDLTHDRRIANWTDVRAATMGIPDARNKICSLFLESDCEWMFCIDSDMGFEQILLDQLLAVADAKERPVVGGLAFSFRESLPDGKNGFRCFPSPTIMDYWQHDDGVYRYTARSHYPFNTMVKCGATGAACLVIHRSVIEKMAGHWFDRIQDENGEWWGEDISFCHRLSELEIPLYIHTGIRTTHFKHLWLSEEDFWDSFLPPPAEQEVDVIVPVLHRPQNVRTLMTSLKASTGLATAWFVCEPGDTEEMNEVSRYGGRVLIHEGTFAQKVNMAYRAVHDGELMLEAPWVLLVGDDVRFRPSWLDHAQDVARRYKPAVIGTNDLANARVIRGEHATHMMIRRDYIDEHGASWDGPGIICHEGYRHWYVDDEIVTVAKQRNTFQSAHGSQVEHMHPIFGGAEMDDVYKKGMEHTEEDKKLFESRFLAYTQSKNGARPNRATRRSKKPQLSIG